MPDRTWVIDVCNTCGALAQWPYSCGHRPEGADLYMQGDRRVPWCSPVTVRGTWKQRPAGSGRAAERVEGAIKLGANPAADHVGIFDGPAEPIHMSWMSSLAPEVQDAIAAAATCPCRTHPCTCQRADQTQEGDR